MVINAFGIIGAIGIIFLSIGILNKKRQLQDKYYALGGIFLLVYSISIKNIIFIIVQVIFTLTAIYDLNKKRKKKKCVI